MYEGLNFVETVLVIDSCAQGMSVPEICSAYKLEAAAVRKAIKASSARGKSSARKRARKSPSKAQAQPLVDDSSDTVDLGGRPVSAKTLFVAGLPGDLPIAQVVERADKAGLVLSANHVSKIRARSNAAPVLKAALLDKYKERVCAWFVDDDRSANYIARKLGVSQPTVMRALRRWGVPTPQRAEKVSEPGCRVVETAEASQDVPSPALCVDSMPPGEADAESGRVVFLRSGVVLRKRADFQVANDVREESMGATHA